MFELNSDPNSHLLVLSKIRIYTGWIQDPDIYRLDPGSGYILSGSRIRIYTLWIQDPDIYCLDPGSGYILSGSRKRIYKGWIQDPDIRQNRMDSKHCLIIINQVLKIELYVTLSKVPNY